MKIATKNVTPSGVTFTFGNGEVITYELAALSDAMIQRLAVHGLSQKVGDSYASAINVSDAIEKAAVTFEMLVDGDWSTGRVGSGGDLLPALVTATGKSLEDCQELLAGMDKDSKKELRKHPAVATALADIAAKKAKAKADKLAQSGDGDTIDLGGLFDQK